MAAKLSSETDFLRDFAGTYLSEIAFTEAAFGDIRRYQRLGRRIGLADVLFVLKNGEVTISEKEDADGAKWWVEGETCNGDGIAISIEVWCDRYHVRVCRVNLFMGVSHV